MIWDEDEKSNSVLNAQFNLNFLTLLGLQKSAGKALEFLKHVIKVIFFFFRKKIELHFTAMAGTQTIALKKKKKKIH